MSLGHGCPLVGSGFAIPGAGGSLLSCEPHLLHELDGILQNPHPACRPMSTVLWEGSGLTGSSCGSLGRFGCPAQVGNLLPGGLLAHDH
jgi:hypothetical protein